MDGAPRIANPPLPPSRVFDRSHGEGRAELLLANLYGT